MRKSSTKRVWIGAAVIASLLGWYVLRPGGEKSSDGDRVAHDSDAGLLLDRVWVDSKPERYTDYIHVMLALSHAPIGIFQKASNYQATMELFEFKRKGNRLLVNFPQTGTRREATYRIRTCDDLPPFDLCLDLSENPWGGPRRYYGLEDPDQEAAHLGTLRHQLEHRLPADQN